METNFRFRIDWKKWNDDVDLLLVRREKWPKLVQEVKDGKKTWKEIGYWAPDWNDELTTLYSIRAQAHGRLHRKGAKLTFWQYSKLGYNKYSSEEFNKNGGKIKVPLTFMDQITYIGNKWRQYEVGYITPPSLIPIKKHKWWEFWKNKC